MRAVYKYEIGPEVKMPAGSQIVTVAEQAGMFPCLWAEVDTDRPTVVRQFVVLATGEEMPNDIMIGYVGTIHNSQGRGLVWHIYEVLE